jgi:ribose transport system ATP-binding protein
MHIAAAPHPVLVRMTGITKRFGPVAVLRDVNFELRAGEVHVLAGENGAGKSTLIKILAGVHPLFDGHIEIAGQPVRPRSPTEATALGVAVIHQELSLIEPMTVADNILLGNMPTCAGFVQSKVQHDEARRALIQLGLELDVSRPVEEFPIAIRQLIEIAKVLRGQARVIVMDEPTSALNAPEVKRLFALIHRLKATRLRDHLYHPQDGGNRAHRRPHHGLARRHPHRHGARR